MYSRQHIKVFFKNGLTCEGIVIKWKDNQAFLSSLSNDDILHLYNLKEDVMMVRIFAQEEEEEEEEEGYMEPRWVRRPAPPPEPEPEPEPEHHGVKVEAVDYKKEVTDQRRRQHQHRLQQQQQQQQQPEPPLEIDNAPIVEPDPPQVNFHPDTKHNLRLKKLAELRNMQREALKDQVVNRMRSHVPTNSGTSLDPYDTPNFTKPGPQNNTPTQNRRRVRKDS